MPNADETALTIRPREDRDLNACAEILIDVHRTDGYPVEGVADPIAWLQPPGLIRAWIAELSGTVVGHVAVTEPQPSDGAPRVWLKIGDPSSDAMAVLGRLFVHSRARGKQAGARLVKAATEFATKEGHRLVLDVMRKDRTAISLYEKLGWINIGDIKHEFGADQRNSAFAYVSPQQPRRMV